MCWSDFAFMPCRRKAFEETIEVLVAVGRRVGRAPGGELCELVLCRSDPVEELFNGSSEEAARRSRSFISPEIASDLSNCAHGVSGGRYRFFTQAPRRVFSIN
jgi:hypothetical protein